MIRDKKSRLNKLLKYMVVEIDHIIPISKGFKYASIVFKM